MLTWLNASAVKKALNVPPDAYLFLTDNGVGFNYSLTEKNLMPPRKRTLLGAFPNMEPLENGTDSIFFCCSTGSTRRAPNGRASRSTSLRCSRPRGL
jgi:hypothetical protein